jgi:hypothetical protein
MARIRLHLHLFFVCLAAVWLLANPAKAQDITPFLGSFEGNATFDENGTSKRRDMSVVIAQTDAGFSVSWASVTYKSDGRTKEKSYTIDFQPSQRDGIYASAMKSNVFGKQVPLDPLQGEPFVWARIVGPTLTVFSLFIDEAGDYEMQEYHRSLADGGLNLEFRRLRNGSEIRSIETFLTRK